MTCCLYNISLLMEDTLFTQTSHVILRPQHMKITGFWVAETAFFSLRPLFVARTARHALIIQFVQMQRR